jgi:hypothetical protein|nr:MAG TPA: Protein of unknown function (DUF3644) [Caudoviricetes sp.]
MNEENLINKMTDKSIESFLLGIEIYNKPTIKYRTESFAFHICNAWELMLKAHLIKTQGLKSIYYTKKNKKGTIQLKTALGRIITNKIDPIRKNLEDVIELRNTSTHFIIEDYNKIYVHIFQSCAYNYYNFLEKYFKSNISQIDLDFILLITPKNNNSYLNLSNFDNTIINKFIEVKNNIEEKTMNNKSENYSVNINYMFTIGNQKINIDPNSKNVVSIPNFNDLYPHRQKEVCIEINKQLKEIGITKNFRQYELSEINKCYKLKDNLNYYNKVNENATNPTWICSRQLVDFVVNLFKQNKNILDEIIEQNKKDSSE